MAENPVHFGENDPTEESTPDLFPKDGKAIRNHPYFDGVKIGDGLLLLYYNITFHVSVLDALTFRT
jgi:hypothetical protein